MKLETVYIKNFRSIIETELPVDEKLTAIIGENEHGKTNLLWSIKFLDFTTQLKASDKRISRKASENKDLQITYELRFDENEITYLRSFVLSQNLPKDGKPSLKEAKKSSQVSKKFDIPEKIKLQVDYVDDKETSYFILDLPKKLADPVFEFIRSSLMNSVFYFDTFEECIKHKISKEEVLDRTDNITNGLIKLAGLKDKESLIFEDTPTARQLLIDSSQELTENLRQIWLPGREENIEVILSVTNDGQSLTVDIGDTNTYGAVSSRSRGFLFFLSFILKFKECHDGDFKDLIILIDEPGMFLHPKGQRNLLSYLESLAEFNQVIYTTHSPFMVNRLKGNRVRIAMKKAAKGTVVNTRPYGNVDEAFIGDQE